MLLRYWKDDIDRCYYEYFVSTSFPRWNIMVVENESALIEVYKQFFPQAINCTKFAAFTTKFTIISPFCQTVYIVKQMASVEDNIRKSKLTLLTSKPGWISTTCNELDQLKLILAVKEWWKPWTPEIQGKKQTDTSMFINIITTAAAFGREVASLRWCSMMKMFHHKNAHGKRKKYSKNPRKGT